MKKFAFRFFLALTLAFAQPQFSPAQTLANMDLVDTLTQKASSFNYTTAVVDSSTGFYIALNSYTSGVQTVAGIYNLSPVTGVNWVTFFNYNSPLQDYITNV
jgi:hypothetical protein